MLNSILRQTSVSVPQDMAEMPHQQVLVAAHADLLHSRAMWAMSNAPLVLLDHLFLVVAPRLQVQILVFVERMLNSILIQIDVSALPDMGGMPQVPV